MEKYPYITGNIEASIRINNGEDSMKVLQEIEQKWTPGNEYLWDNIDIETLIDSPEKQRLAVNNLIFHRIKKYRELTNAGKMVKGTDPFKYKE